jgi:hypothetical protein
MVTLNESPSRSSRGCLKTLKSLVVPWVELLGNHDVPSLMAIRKRPTASSRLGSELYGDDNLEAHLIKVQTKNYHLNFYVFCKGNPDSQFGSKRVHYKSDLGGKKPQLLQTNNTTAGFMCLSQDPYVCSSPEGMDGPTPTPSPKCSNSNKAQFVHLGTSADHEYLLVVICKMGVPKSNNYVHL